MDITNKDLREAGMKSDGVPVGVYQHFVPAYIELVNGEYLQWKWSPEWYYHGRETVHGGKLVTPGPGLLTGFQKLADAAPTRMLDYAREWGVLDLCIFEETGSIEPWKPHPCACSHPQSWCRERLVYWRYYARQTLALCKVVAALRKGKPASRRDWITLYEAHPDDPYPSSEKEVEDRLDQDLNDEFHFTGKEARGLSLSDHVDVERRLVATTLNGIVHNAGVRLELEWKGTNPRVQLGGRTLLAAVAVQLLFMVGRTQGLDFCSGCGGVYIPKKQPRPGENNYCNECRKSRVPQQDAMRRLRSQPPEANSHKRGRKKKVELGGGSQSTEL